MPVFESVSAPEKLIYEPFYQGKTRALRNPLKDLRRRDGPGVPRARHATRPDGGADGQLETDFQFSNDSQTPPGRTNRRVVGKYGDGSGRVELDSFSGHVHLRKKSSRAVALTVRGERGVGTDTNDFKVTGLVKREM